VGRRTKKVENHWYKWTLIGETFYGMICVSLMRKGNEDNPSALTKSFASWHIFFSSDQLIWYFANHARTKLPKLKVF